MRATSIVPEEDERNNIFNLFCSHEGLKTGDEFYMTDYFDWQDSVYYGVNVTKEAKEIVNREWNI